MLRFVRHRIFGLAGLLLLIALCPAASGLLADPTTRPAPADVLVTRAERLDDETAALMEQRPAAGQPADPTLELQIDLRVTASWLLHQSAENASDEIQSCAYLRARSMLSAADLLAQHLRKSPPGPAQINALAKLHEMTYRLADLKSVARMDESCKALANLLVTIGGPLPNPGQELPLMRPMEVEGPDLHPQPPSLAELMTAAKQASVSPALRRQLLALAQATAAASADPNRQKEAAALYGVLTRAVEMTRGLQPGSLVDPQTRGRIEPQLADGIVLFLDPRTRAAGTSRVERLAAFGQMLQRLRALPIAPDMRDRLAPALGWAQKHPEQGPQVVQTLVEFLGLCHQFDARKPSTSLADAQRKVVSELERQFAAHRQAFLGDAANLSDSAATTAVIPQHLAAHLAAMQQTFEQVDLVASTPAALQAVGVFKPRPTGGLERRALVAVSAVAGSVQSPTPAEAVRFLKQLQTLGKVAGQIGANDLPSEINRLYAAGKFSELNTRRAEMLLDMANQAASGKSLDATRLARLSASQDLVDAAREGAQIEAALQQADALNRWADWHVEPPTLRRALTPYRDATATAIGSFADGDAGALDTWTPIRHHAEPLLALLREVGMYGEPCRQLPTGWPGELARLLTPMDHQPFALERHASLLFAAWEAATAEATAADTQAASELLEAQLRKDLGMLAMATDAGDR